MTRVVGTLFVAMTIGTGAAVAQTVSERDQHDALKHYQRGANALHDERFDVAEREFQAATTLNPLLYIAHYGLGQVYMSIKRYPSAVRAYRGARDAFHAAAVEALGDEA